MSLIPGLMTPLRRIFFASLAMAICSCATSPTTAEAQSSNAYIVVDNTTGKVLMENNSQAKVPVASLTKIATVAVALDWIERTNIDQGTEIVVPASAGLLGGANPVGMVPGDRISIRDALHCAMMASDNVSAETLADYIGRQMMARSGGRSPVETFVSQMNALAQTLGMTDTRFANPHGLDHAGPVGKSTARDMALITMYAMKRPAFNFLCSQTEREIVYVRGGQKSAFKIKNTNELLGRHGIDGVKTGATRAAGPCLITSARKPDKIVPLDAQRKRRIPYHLICVVLNSPDRFGQSVQLLQSGWAQYDTWLNTGMTVTDPEELLKLP